MTRLTRKALAGQSIAFGLQDVFQRGVANDKQPGGVADPYSALFLADSQASDGKYGLWPVCPQWRQ